MLKKEILEILLKDRTTNRNIIWATDDYCDKGEFYSKTAQIFPELILRENSELVQPRILKSSTQQNGRTRSKAEVFTPSWVCNAQNNLVDTQWFGYENVFNFECNKAWVATTEPIKFPADAKHSWKCYVDARRLEVTCGEAPYLASRYDTVTGFPIPLLSRIGILDRKLRVISENAKDEAEWLFWVYRAYESVYGFEFQGDNLLLARKNLLNTFIDNAEYTLKRSPTSEELSKVAVIISWNIWQMDGLTYGPPLCDIELENEQLSWFNYMESEDGVSMIKPAESRCKIKDWRAKETVEYYSLVKGES